VGHYRRYPDDISGIDFNSCSLPDQAYGQDEPALIRPANKFAADSLKRPSNDFNPCPFFKIRNVLKVACASHHFDNGPHLLFGNRFGAIATADNLNNAVGLEDEQFLV
jgi:hypothetical protein